MTLIIKRYVAIPKLFSGINMFKWTDIKRINSPIIPHKEYSLTLLIRTPIPKINSKTPLIIINSKWKEKKSGIIGK